MDKIALGVIRRHRERREEKYQRYLSRSEKMALPHLWMLVYTGWAIQIIATMTTLWPLHFTGNPAWSFRLIGDLSLGFSVITAYVILEEFITGNEKLPVFYLTLQEGLNCLVVLLLVIVSCWPSDFTLLARWGLAFLSLSNAMIATAVKQEGNEIEKEIAKEKEEASKGNASITYCEVCAKESQYDLCLDCEAKYKAERHKVRAQIMRAKQAHVPATLTLKQWLDNLNMYNWRCAYCQTGPYQVMEHYLPITQGGGTTQENCVPACYACNSKKSDRHPETQQRPTFIRPKGGRK